MAEKMSQIEKFASRLVGEIKQIVRDALARADSRIAELEKRIAELEAKK